MLQKEKAETVLVVYVPKVYSLDVFVSPLVGWLDR